MRVGLVAQHEPDGLSKIAGDTRITRVGRDIRRLSLGGLPHLASALCNARRMAGPLALPMDEDEPWRGYARQRLMHLIGKMAGWHILGSALVLVSGVKLDCLYVTSWSPSSVKLQLRTRRLVAARTGS